MRTHARVETTRTEKRSENVDSLNATCHTHQLNELNLLILAQSTGLTTPTDLFFLGLSLAEILGRSRQYLESRKHLPPVVVTYELKRELEEGDGSPLRRRRVDS